MSNITANASFLKKIADLIGRSFGMKKEEKDDRLKIASNPIPSWEYMTAVEPHSMSAFAMRMHGQDGWELVNVIRIHDATHYHFKRQRTVC